MKVVRKIIEIDEEKCDGCGNCILSCAEGALALVDGKVRVISDNLCDGLGACIGECPTGALRIIEREAEEFDEEAVEAHLENLEDAAAAEKHKIGSGCPSARIQIFAGSPSSQEAGLADKDQGAEASALSHWPVQIRLIPPNAPFLKGADLLVLADCVPVAFPSLHRDFLRGKVVAMGCPKFDDAEEYIQKFAEIFKTAGLKSITTVVMEVPCCSALPMMVKKGLEQSGREIPMEKAVISTKGKILQRIRQ
jgi:Fe-S-cluster-containing hydrogenase component 2